MKTPIKATLQKYGLTEELWIEILQNQGGVCPICLKLPSKERFVVDHQHIRGYKEKSPEEKRKFIRGILCWFCNRYYVTRGITIEKAENVVLYLEDYESRRFWHTK